jgi:hypothetical protein
VQWPPQNKKKPDSVSPALGCRKGESAVINNMIKYNEQEARWAREDEKKKKKPTASQDARALKHNTKLLTRWSSSEQYVHNEDAYIEDEFLVNAL